MSSNDQILEMWHTLNKATALLNQKSATNIRMQHNIHHSWFEVMRELYHAPDHRLKMNEIADKIVRSGSGLTRLIDRMLEAGLIRRELSSVDRRIVVAVLTESGVEKIEAILPQYENWIRDNFLTQLSESEISVIQSVFDRYLETNDK